MKNKVPVKAIFYFPIFPRAHNRTKIQDTWIDGKNKPFLHQLYIYILCIYIEIKILLNWIFVFYFCLCTLCTYSFWETKEFKTCRCVLVLVNFILIFYCLAVLSTSTVYCTFTNSLFLFFLGFVKVQEFFELFWKETNSIITFSSFNLKFEIEKKTIHNNKIKW